MAFTNFHDDELLRCVSEELSVRLTPEEAWAIVRTAAAIAKMGGAHPNCPASQEDFAQLQWAADSIYHKVKWTDKDFGN